MNNLFFLSVESYLTVSVSQLTLNACRDFKSLNSYENKKAMMKF